MASAAALGPYSRSLALRCKSSELVYRGHRERSVDKLREALTAARVIGAEDCLVTAYLTVEVAEDDLISFMRRARETPDAQMDLPSVATKVRECSEAVAGAASVARRRRTSGTDRPAEHAWYVEHHVADVRLGKSCSRSEAMKSVECLAPLSSEVTVSAASDALHFLELAAHLDLFSASELSRRLGAACDLVDEAIPFATLCENNTVCISISGTTMKKRLSIGVELWRQERSTAAYAERLAEALKQLSLRGGVMSADLDELLGTFLAKVDKDVTILSAKVDAAQAAASAPELLRSCALASCGAKEAHVSHFSKCGACKTVVYCSKVCQLADWPDHKKACKAARKAAGVS